MIAHQELRSRPSDFASVPVVERASLARPTRAIGNIDANRIHHGGIGMLTARQFRETTHLDPCLTLGLERELVRAL